MAVTSPDGVQKILYEPLFPALSVGTVAGMGGFAVGGIAGIFTSAHPALFSTVAGFQCFFLGSSYYYFRGAILAATSSKPTKKQELTASGIAGSLAGAAGGALRSRSNILPGALVIGILGLTGQAGFHKARENLHGSEVRKPLLQRVMDSSWFPLKSLSDEEYETMLTKKLLKIEAEISIIDDQIEDLQSKRIDSRKGITIVDEIDHDSRGTLENVIADINLTNGENQYL